MASKNYVSLQDSHLQPPSGIRHCDAPQEEIISVSLYLKPRTAAPSAVAMGAAPVTRASLHAARSVEHHDDVQIVKAFAAEHGLLVTGYEPGRRLVTLAGTTAKLEAAFQTKLGVYEHMGHTFRGREGSLKLPEDLASVVSAVFGLDTRPIAHPNSNPVSVAAAGSSSHNPNSVGALYNFPTGVNGAGQCIAIIELGGGYTAADTNQAFAAMGLTPPQVVSVSVNGAINSPGGPTSVDFNEDGENALDIQISGGIAPGAKVAVYFAPNTADGFVKAVSTAVHDTTNSPSVISISWGTTETNYSVQFRNQMDAAFQDAITLNISVFVASGDHLGTDGNADGRVHVQYPASSPYAIGCGGTLIMTNGNTIVAESAWNDGSPPLGQAPWGTGGGVSALYPVPAFQAAANIPVNVSTGAGGRGVPDVAADGASGSGYNIVVRGTSGAWFGTSAVAPLWAGLTALINQNAPQHIGFFLPFLYNNPTLLRDVNQGDNKPISTGLGYPAGNGWDACTGLGVPDGTKLLNALLGTQLDHSRWDSTYQSPGGPVRALITFNGSSGIYQLLDAVGHVMSAGNMINVQYQVTNPSVWAIFGNWSFQGVTGTFQFHSQGGTDNFVGTWMSPTIGHGFWNGHRL